LILASISWEGESPPSPSFAPLVFMVVVAFFVLLSLARAINLGASERRSAVACSGGLLTRRSVNIEVRCSNGGNLRAFLTPPMLLDVPGGGTI
jgi:hypothetical protein